METMVKFLGKEKKHLLVENFNLLVDKYRKIADALGYKNELKFKKNGGFIDVFVVV